MIIIYLIVRNVKNIDLILFFQLGSCWPFGGYSCDASWGGERGVYLIWFASVDGMMLDWLYYPWWQITQSQITNLDQIKISESRLSINFKISTKHHHLNLKLFWPNLASESRPRFNFITSTKHQQQNTDQTPASNLTWTSTSKSWSNLVLKVWTHVLLYDQTSATKSSTNCCQHDPYY